MIVFETTLGSFSVELFEREAPKSCANVGDALCAAFASKLMARNQRDLDHRPQ